MMWCGGGVRAAADWASLPDLALELIVERLDSPKSCVRFVMVCKRWGSFVFRLWPPKFRSVLNDLARHPMLLIGDKHAFSVFAGKVFPLDLDERRSNLICDKTGIQSVTIGSSFGCWITYNSSHYLYAKLRIVDSRRIYGCYFVRHPVTIYQSPFPAFQTKPKRAYTQLSESRAVKAVTAMPISPDLFNAAAIWYTSSSADHLLLLQATTSVLQMDGHLHRIWGRILDIASIDSTVFCLVKRKQGLYVSSMSMLFKPPLRGRIVLYNDQSMSIEAKLPTPTLTRYCTVYLVGSDYPLAPWPWLVFRIKTIDSGGNMSTVGFQVFEMVRSITRRKHTDFCFVRVSKLQNNVLFIGQKSAFRVAAGGSGSGSGLIAALGLLKPNTVYYLDDRDRENGDGIGSSDHSSSNNSNVSDLDIGVFDLEHCCRRPFPIPEHAKQLLSDELMKHHSPPLWFLN